MRKPFLKKNSSDSIYSIAGEGDKGLHTFSKILSKTKFQNRVQQVSLKVMRIFFFFKT